MIKSPNIESIQMESHEFIKHYVILWLDSNVSHTIQHARILFNTTHHFIDSIKTCLNIDQCIDFLQTITNKHVFLIINDLFHAQSLRNLIRCIEETSQIDSVFVFANSLSEEQSCLNECSKLHGIFPEIEQISSAFKRRIGSSNILTQLDDDIDENYSSYVYSKLLTDMIFQLEYDERGKKETFSFYHEFEQNYHRYSPIWWFIQQSNIPVLIKDALITQNIDMMIKFGIFLRDLHREIKQIHSETYQTTKFTVYHSEQMSPDDFQQCIKHKKGSLYSFHHFLLTSTNRDVALRSTRSDKQNIRILFEMEIDPCICSIPYAYLDDSSYYFETGSFVLFSTHTIFRISEITEVEDQLWKVKLTLTNDIHQRLEIITEHVSNEMMYATGWRSLIGILFKMDEFDKAIYMLKNLSEIMNRPDQDRSICNNIGLIYDSMGEYSNALLNYQQILKIQGECLTFNHPSLAILYNNIAMTYRSMGDYNNALSYCEKALEIREKLSSADHISLTTLYSNIGTIHEAKGDYKTALSFYEKVHEIQKSSLSTDHPSFALTYNNLGAIHCLTGQYSDALLHYQKALKIQRETLVPNHSSIAITFSNIGDVYQFQGNYTISLSYYEKALKIQQKIRSSNQLVLATTYNNIGLAYRMMDDYPNAQLYYSKALQIEEKTLPLDHPSLALTYNNLGGVYQSIGDYSQAITFYEKTLQIWQKSLPSDHPLMATIYNNMGTIHDLNGDYSEALCQYKKAVEILEKLPSINPLNLAATHNNMGEIYRLIGDYPNALLYYRKTLEIEEKYLPHNHPSIAITISNMAVAFNASKQVEQAIEHAKRALDIIHQAFGPNHSQTRRYQEYVNQLRERRTSS